MRVVQPEDKPDGMDVFHSVLYRWPQSLLQPCRLLMSQPLLLLRWGVVLAMPGMHTWQHWCESRGHVLVQAMFVEALGGDLGDRLMGVLPGWAIYAADLVFAMYVLINLMGCLWLFTGITEYKQGGHCWLESVGKPKATSCIIMRLAGTCGRPSAASVQGLPLSDMQACRQRGRHRASATCPDQAMSLPLQ